MPFQRPIARLRLPASPPPPRAPPCPRQWPSFIPPRSRMRRQQLRYNGDTSKQRTRVERILSKLPPSMQKYASRLRNAPMSHVAAFTILHELTAVIPLFGLFALFHYTDYVPLGYMMEHYGSYVQDGVERFERYFTRKGWFGFGQEDTSTPGTPILAGKSEKEGEDVVLDKWASSDTKYKIVVEVALAYAITKALLPVRIMGSLWATPWFAGLLVRLRGFAGDLKRRK